MPPHLALVICSLRCLFGGPAEAVALGFQHYLVMLGSSVMIPSILVPMMGGTDVSLLLTMPTISFVLFCCLQHSHMLQASVFC